MDLSGRLSTFPLADLLQWAYHDRSTGELVVRRSHREKRVFFRKGEIKACYSDDPAEYYGRHLVLNEMLNKKQVVFALTYCQRRGTRLGVALQELGLLPADEIQRTLRRQIEDSVCDLFLWRRGVFFFQERQPPEEDLLPEPINTLGLVLEGARWMDEYRRIRELILHDDVLLLPGPNVDAKKDGPLKRRIGEQMKGEISVGALYKVIQGSYFRFLEALFDLCNQNALKLEIVGEGDAGESSKEIGIYDLLLEQATEEQSTRLRRRLALPPDIIEEFYPVWVREPSPKDLQDLPPEMAQWLMAIDGSRTLGEILASEESSNSQRTDFLGLQLRQGALALLPQQLEQLQEEAERRGASTPSQWPVVPLRGGELIPSG